MLEIQQNENWLPNELPRLTLKGVIFNAMMRPSTKTKHLTSVRVRPAGLYEITFAALLPTSSLNTSKLTKYELKNVS